MKGVFDVLGCVADLHHHHPPSSNILVAVMMKCPDEDDEAFLARGHLHVRVQLSESLFYLQPESSVIMDDNELTAQRPQRSCLSDLPPRSPDLICPDYL